MGKLSFLVLEDPATHRGVLIAFEAGCLSTRPLVHWAESYDAAVEEGDKWAAECGVGPLVRVEREGGVIHEFQ